MLIGWQERASTMKRFALIFVLFLLTNSLVFIDDLAETKAQDKKGVPQLRSNTDDQDRIYWGQELPQGLTETVKRYRESAERGYAPAQFKLALMYDSGQGVPQDYAEAVKWLRKAAEQDFVDAQYNLGSMYDSGQGLPQDYAEAVNWFRKAAERGHASAQKNLGSKYGKGQGVPQNHAETYVWSSIAAKSGDKDAINSRDFAASKLSPEDLGSAQERAAKLDEEIQQRKAAQ